MICYIYIKVHNKKTNLWKRELYLCDERYFAGDVFIFLNIFWIIHIMIERKLNMVKKVSTFIILDKKRLESVASHMIQRKRSDML